MKHSQISNLLGVEKKKYFFLIKTHFLSFIVGEKGENKDKIVIILSQITPKMKSFNLFKIKNI